MNSKRFRQLGLTAAFGMIAVSHAAMFSNYGWQTGNTIPWAGTFTPNGAVVNWGLDILDIDGAGPLGTTMTYFGQHGQDVFDPGVPAGVNIFQSISLFDGCAYQVEYDWAADNTTGPSGNAQGGIFNIIVDGSAIATQASDGISAFGFENDHIVGKFKNTGTGPHGIGARITRPYQIPTQLQQWLDNFAICPIYWDGDFSSGVTTNWNYPPTGNGQTSSISNVASGAAPLSPLGTGNAIRLQVGQVVFNSGVFEGVSVGQPVHLNAYTSYRLSADVGASNTATSGSNAQGGRFQLFVGGALVGPAFSVGSIGFGTSVTNSVSGTINIGPAGGSFFSGVRVTRPFTPPPALTLWQYVDNIAIEKAYVTVSGRVHLQAWDGPYTYPPLQIYLVKDGEIHDEHEINMDATGDYSFRTALRGSFDIWVKSTHWLAVKHMAVPIDDSGVTGLNYSLINGDADPDNEVNLVDGGRIAASFGLAAGDPGFDWWADLDGDGEITLVDNGIFSANFGMNGDDVL